ncbi:MAG: hypothetical protein ACQKBV_06540 [Puniceicoccales bacterium]
MDADLQQYLPLLGIILGVFAVAIFIKKTGTIGVIIVVVLAGVWLLRENPEWFAGLDGTMERLVEVKKTD